VKKILVTGGNKGIGLAIVEKILKTNDQTFVYLGSRNTDRGEEAKNSILKKNSSYKERIEVLTLDVSSEDSVLKAGQRVEEKILSDGKKLYGIVNNAGVMLPESQLEDVLQVNVHGIYRISNRFLPLLDEKKGRIVNITSAAGPSFVLTCNIKYKEFLTSSDISWDALKVFMDECIRLRKKDGDFEKEGLGEGPSYGLSKAIANTLTLNLAKIYPTFKINACTPGFIKTDMTRPMAKAWGKTPEEAGMKEPSFGTLAPLFLLFEDSVRSGDYYGSDALRSPIDHYRSPGTPAFNDKY
jgi:NAD(P)-dependent dehydrogenase (short-subunit alcohol dehydrogenase family)